MNTTYRIDGQAVTLVNGVAEVEAAPGSASKVITKYFGNQAMGDLNGDGVPDQAFLLTQERGGSGTFFYIVAAVHNAAGRYSGSDAVLLGDRIAPHSTEIRGGNVVVKYAVRADGEPMATPPSVGRSLTLKLDPQTMQLGEVEQNVEGEVDLAKMKLDMKVWTWVSARYKDGREIVPKKAGEFTLEFGKDGRFSAQTDCNSMSGTYTVKDTAITFGQIAMTKTFCEGSLEGDFSTLLETTQGFHFTSKGELILDLKFDSGSATLR